MDTHPQHDSRIGVNFSIIKQGSDKTWYVVLQQRDENSREYKLHWCIPGGGLKAHENSDFAAAASREAADETGLTIPADAWHEVCNRPAHNPGKVLLAVVSEDSEIIRGEGAAMEWKSFAEIQEIITEGKMGYGHESWLLPELKNYISENLAEYSEEATAEQKPPRPFKFS